MPGNINFEIKGAKEMERLLKELGPRVAQRVGDAALRAGAKPIVDAAKQRVAVRSGALRDSITVVSDRRRNDDARVVLIGFKKPASGHAHLIEFGTAHSAAKPFMRPAMDEKAQEALNEEARVLARGIDREAKKLAKP